MIQRILVAPLFIAAVIFADDKPMSFAMDATYAGIHAPSTLKHIIVLGWILLGVATVSACFYRCYKWPKAVVLFAGLSALMAFMTLNTMDVYEPYLAIRR